MQWYIRVKKDAISYFTNSEVEEKLFVIENEVEAGDAGSLANDSHSSNSAYSNAYFLWAKDDDDVSL